MREAFAIGVTLSAKDLASRVFARADANLKRLRQSSELEARKYEQALRFGKRLAVAGGAVTAASWAISAGLDRVAQHAMNLDQALADVSTVLDDTARLSEFRAVALEASARSMFGASEYLSQGAYNLLSAGLTADEALAILPRVGQLAVGTFDDIQGATNNATTGMMAYKALWKDMTPELRAARVTDALARAIQLFKYVGPELATTLQYSGAAAAAAGVPMEDMLAAVGSMKSAGLEASMAGTSYRMMLEKLPELEKRTGIAAADAAGNMRPLVDVFRDLRKRYGGEFSLRELEEISDIFDVRAAGGVKALLTNLDSFVAASAGMQKPGAAMEMYEKRMAGAVATQRALTNEFENAQAELGQGLLPVLREKQRIMTGLMRTVERMPMAKETLAVVGLAAELGKLVGPLVAAVGMWKVYHTQQQIALALQGQLNAATAGAGPAAGLGAAGKGLLGGAAGVGGAAAGLAAAGTVAGMTAATLAGAAVAKAAEEGRRDEARKLAAKPGELSAGERRKLAEAAEMYAEPEVVMAALERAPAEAAAARSRAWGAAATGARIAGSYGGDAMGAAPSWIPGASQQVTISGMSINLNGTGNTRDDARRLAREVARELGPALRREALRQ